MLVRGVLQIVRLDGFCRDGIVTARDITVNKGVSRHLLSVLLKPLNEACLVLKGLHPPCTTTTIVAEYLNIAFLMSSSFCCSCVVPVYGGLRARLLRGLPQRRRPLLPHPRRLLPGPPHPLP